MPWSSAAASGSSGSPTRSTSASIDICAALGLGGWFPWSVPALRSGATGDPTLTVAPASVVAVTVVAATAAYATAASVLVDPDEFARRVEDPEVVTINVHIPNEGNIAGTDLEIAFDQVSTSNELPADLTTPLAVYCRSGNMSATAVEDLQAKGYVDVVELSGGYDAWLEAGRTLEQS